MSVVRIAVASTPLTTTLDEAIPAAVAAIEEAGRLGAAIVCLPESTLPPISNSTMQAGSSRVVGRRTAIAWSDRRGCGHVRQERLGLRCG